METNPPRPRLAAPPPELTVTTTDTVTAAEQRRDRPGSSMSGPTTGIPKEISQKVGDGRFEFSQHATDQTILRAISVQEVREALRQPELIEYYPHDKYGPSMPHAGLHQGGQTPAHSVQPSVADVEATTRPRTTLRHAAPGGLADYDPCPLKRPPSTRQRRGRPSGFAPRRAPCVATTCSRCSVPCSRDHAVYS